MNSDDDSDEDPITSYEMYSPLAQNARIDQISHKEDSPPKQATPPRPSGFSRPSGVPEHPSNYPQQFFGGKLTPLISQRDKIASYYQPFPNQNSQDVVTFVQNLNTDVIPAKSTLEISEALEGEEAHSGWDTSASSSPNSSQPISRGNYVSKKRFKLVNHSLDEKKYELPPLVDSADKLCRVFFKFACLVNGSSGDDRLSVVQEAYRMLINGYNLFYAPDSDSYLTLMVCALVQSGNIQRLASWMNKSSGHFILEPDILEYVVSRCDKWGNWNPRMFGEILLSSPLLNRRCYESSIRQETELYNPADEIEIKRSLQNKSMILFAKTDVRMPKTNFNWIINNQLENLKSLMSQTRTKLAAMIVITYDEDIEDTNIYVLKEDQKNYTKAYFCSKNKDTSGKLEEIAQKLSNKGNKELSKEIELERASGKLPYRTVDCFYLIRKFFSAEPKNKSKFSTKFGIRRNWNSNNNSQ